MLNATAYHHNATQPLNCKCAAQGVSQDNLFFSYARAMTLGMAMLVFNQIPDIYDILASAVLVLISKYYNFNMLN